MHRATSPTRSPQHHRSAPRTSTALSAMALALATALSGLTALVQAAQHLNVGGPL